MALRWPAEPAVPGPQEGEKPGRSIAILEKCTSIWLGSVAKMAPPRDRLDPRHIRIRKVATFK